MLFYKDITYDVSLLFKTTAVQKTGYQTELMSTSNSITN